MKKPLNRKTFQIIGSAILFAISFILFHYSHLATLHGKSDAPIIVGIFGVLALLISYIFDLKALTITATFGYIIAFILGICLDTDGIVPGDKLTHQLWLVWLISYWIFIGLGIIYDFLRKIKYQKEATKSKSLVLYIGLLIGIFIVISSIFVYLTRSLTMNEVLQHKPRFSGVVVEINDDTSILVKANENDPIMKSSDLIIVTLDVKMSDVSVRGRDFNIGDEVTVYYDGTIAERYPAQVNKVYAIFHNSSSE
ncbi:MAG: hypothetical protein GX915_10510 [Clostridiales bacterium]|nr:hypothetical protein [Clostridiales bacterium]